MTKSQIAIAYPEAEGYGISELAFACWVARNDDLTPEAKAHVRQSWREGSISLLLPEGEMKNILKRIKL